MLETSTTRRDNNLSLDEWNVFPSRAEATSKDVEFRVWQEQGRSLVPDYFGTQVGGLHPLPSINEFWNDHQTIPMSGSRAIVNSEGFLWHRNFGARGLMERYLVDRLVPRLVWRHSNDPNPRDSRKPEAFNVITNEAGDMLASEIMEIWNSFVKVWKVRVHDASGRHIAAVVDRDEERLAFRLRASFEDNPIEDGMEHPAEKIISEAVLSTNDKPILDWLRAICTDRSQPSFAASVLRCLGRHFGVGNVLWRVKLVSDGLTIDNVEIRDAAVQAAEC